MSDTQTTATVEVEPESAAPEQALPPAVRPRAQVVAREDPRTSAPAMQPAIVAMSEGPMIGDLFGALAAAQAEFGDVERTLEAKVNSAKASYVYKYETMADVLAAVRPALSKNGLAVMQFPFTRANNVVVKTLLGHKSGAWIANDLSASIYGTDPQAVGSGISYVKRYALKSMLGISPTSAEEDDGARAAGVGASDLPKPTPRKSQQQKSAPAPSASAVVPTAAPAPVIVPEAEKPTAPAQTSDTTQSPAPWGRVAKLAQKGTGLLVTLETGYVASTRDPQMVDALKRHEATGTSIELTCRPSNDPSKYAPVIVEMATQVRE